ncbi:MAG: S41 family peptidase [Kiloniellaceae bacterium]
MKGVLLRMSRPGVTAAMLAMLVGCAGGPPVYSQEDRAAHVVEAVLTDISEVYYKETEASDLVAAGFAKIDKEFGDIAFEREGTDFVATVDGERAYAFQPRAYNSTAVDWAPEVSALLARVEALRSADVNPDLSILVDTFIEGVTDSLDRRTHYVSLQDARAIRLQWSGKVGTVGISIHHGASGWEVKGINHVDFVVPQSLLRGDVILEIDGVPVAGLAMKEVLALLHGELGSWVRFTVERAGTTAPFSVTLQRIEAASIAFSSSPVGNSTHIIMTGFTNSAAPDLQAVLDQDTNSGLGKSNGLILDLRKNPGGLLTAVADTVKIFLSRGTAFATHGRHPKSHQLFSATGGAYAESPPIVVLLDEYSAAGSEIVAAALQVSGRAIVIGTTSFGAGTIQTVLPLPNSGQLVLTWAEVFTPAGYRLEKRGVMPTVCTGGDVTAETVLAELRRGGGVIDPATRARDIDPDDEAAVAAFRALCPPRGDGADISLEVARALLADPALFSRVLADSVRKPETTAAL